MINHPIPPEVVQRIIQHAHRTFPDEMCGVVVENRRFFPASNIAPNPNNQFEIDPMTYALAEGTGRITAICHSHTHNNMQFSATDVQQCKRWEIPYFLYTLPLGTMQYIDPTARVPLLERPFIYGIYDCYGLVRDAYAQLWQIFLDDFDRGPVFDWLQPNWNKFLENLTRQGFTRLAEEATVETGDFLLMQIESPQPNHCGVMINAAQNRFYHHLLGRLSEPGVYGGSWKKRTVGVYRHQRFGENHGTTHNGKTAG